MIERLFRYQASSDCDSYSVGYSWHKKRRVLRELFARALSDSPRAELAVLDIGCGDGFDLFMLRGVPGAERVSRWTGVDLDAGNIEYCRARAASDGDPRLRFHVRDVVAAPLGPDEGADVIVCSEVVEHLAEPQRLIEAMAGALLPGGCLILTTPNGSSWSGRVRRLLGGAPPPVAGGAVGHIAVRGRREWRLICERAGLRLVAERRGSLVYGSPAIDRRRWFAGPAIALDGVLDALRLNDLSWETLQLYRRV